MSRYLDQQMNNYHLEQMFQRRIDDMRQEFERRFEDLERPPRPTANLIASPNYIWNSHPEWSHKAWTTASVSPSDSSDDNQRLYNWFYQEQSQTTLSASGTVTATQGPIIATSHSAFTPPNTPPNANAPIWDKVNARFLTGHTTAAYDIACPLARDFVFPGHRYYIYFEASKTDDSVDLQDAEFYCGFWDNTSGQRKWIEGADFIPTWSIYGAGGTRTLQYKVIAATDGGDEIGSTVLTVNNAPNTLSPTNHVRLSLAGAPGFISYKIYRYDGLVYRLVGDIRNSIDLQFYDMQEGGGSPAAGFPSATFGRPQAKITTQTLAASANSYTPHTLVIQVPTTYNKALTGNNQQWFRFGINGPISAQRGLIVRRIMVSEGFGPWTRAQADFTQPLSSPSSTASSSPTSATTIGGGPTGGTWCVTLDTLVEVIASVDKADVIESIPISKIIEGMKIVCGTTVLPVIQVKDGVVQETYTIFTKRGFELTCSASHRLIKSRFDANGTAAQHLKIGDKLLTSEEGTLAQDEIVRILHNIEQTQVRTLSLPSPHLYVTNGLVSHNNKAEPRDNEDYPIVA